MRHIFIYFSLILATNFNSFAQQSVIDTNLVQKIFDKIQDSDAPNNILYLHYELSNNFEIVENAAQLQYFISLLDNKRWNSPILKKNIQYYVHTYPAIIEKNLDKRIILLLDYLEKYTKEDVRRANILHQLAMSYYVSKDFANAFTYFIKCNNVLQKIGYGAVPEIGVYLHDYALAAYTFKDYPLVIQLMKNAIQYPKYSENFDIQRYFTLATAYEATKQKDSARKYNSLTLEKAQLYSDTTWIAISSLKKIELGSLDINQKIAYIHQSIEVIETWYANNKVNNSEMNILYKKFHLKLLQSYCAAKQLDKAAPLYHKIISNSYDIDDRNLFQTEYRNIGLKKMELETFRTYFIAINDYKNALLYTDSLQIVKEKIAQDYNDLILKVSNDNLMISQNKYNLEKLEFNKKINLSLIAILSILVIAILMLYLFVRNKKTKEKLEHEKVALELQHKIELNNKELEIATQNIQQYINNINEQNLLIENINQKLNALKSDHNNEEVQIIENKVEELRNTRILTEVDWMNFQKNYETYNATLYKNIRKVQPKLSESEVRYLLLISLDIKNKDIASILGISPDSLRVTWNRIKKKLGDKPVDTAHELIANIHNYIPNETTKAVI